MKNPNSIQRSGLSFSRSLVLFYERRELRTLQLDNNITPRLLRKGEWCASPFNGFHLVEEVVKYTNKMEVREYV